MYRRFLPMATRNEEYDVTFYPEGGYLLNGLECRVAFKAMGRTGNAATISLDVVDEAGEIITSTRTLHEGMGTFMLTPEIGKTYLVK